MRARNYSIFASVLFIVSCGAIDSSQNISAEQITFRMESDGGTVQFMNEVIKGYMESDFVNSYEYLLNNCKRKTNKANDYQDARISWSGGVAPYKVTISRNSNMSDGITRTTERKFVYPSHAYPNTEYYFQVEDKNGLKSDVGHFVTSEGPRIITAREKPEDAGINNVRDIGGWKTEDGKTVKYDLFYRGGMLEGTSTSYCITDYGKQVMNELGIKSEIDFRKTEERGGQVSSPLEGCEYYNFEYLGYECIFDEGHHKETVYHDPKADEVIKKVFEMMTEEKNYPFYIHCYAGQDRTGTFAYLVNGLLGVKYEDLTRDYELTAFSKVGEMNRTANFKYTYKDENNSSVMVELNNAWESMNRIMLSSYGNGDGKTSTAIYNFLTEQIGITPEQISKIKSIMLK